MSVRNHEQLTQWVQAVMEQTHDARLREIMVSLVEHLHAFVVDVRLTEPEFRNATALINEIGKLTVDGHNEAVLMAGSLGVSSLVCLLNNGDGGKRETTQNLLGPFWRLNSPPTANGASIVRSRTEGPDLFVTGVVVDRDNSPVVGAEVDVWHASPAGFYENQDSSQAPMNLRGKFMTDGAGHFWFRTVKPVGYPIPTHGVVGRLLKAQGRHPFRPAHLHALIYKTGFKTLISQVYDPEDPNLTTDVQFGVTEAVTGEYLRHGEPHPSVPGATSPWYSLAYTYVMEAGSAELPRPPIK